VAASYDMTHSISESPEGSTKHAHNIVTDWFNVCNTIRHNTIP